MIADIGSGKTDVGSNPTACRVLQASSEEWEARDDASKNVLSSLEVLILDGVVFKKYGRSGQKIGGAFFVWDERDEV